MFFPIFSSGFLVRSVFRSGSAGEDRRAGEVLGALGQRLAAVHRADAQRRMVLPLGSFVLGGGRVTLGAFGDFIWDERKCWGCLPLTSFLL